MFFLNLFRSYKESFSGLPKEAWLLSIAVFVNRIGSMVLFFLSLYLTRKQGFSVTQAGQMVSLYGLGALIGSYSGGWLSDRIGPIRVQLISLLLSALGYVVLGYVTTPFLIGLMLFAVAVVAEALRPANNTAISEVCPPELRARGFALNRLAVNLGISVGPALGGFLALYNYLYLFWIDGLTCLAGFFFLLYFFGTRRNIHSEKQKTDGQEYRSPFKDYFFLFMLAMLLLMGFLFVQFFNTWPLYLRSSYMLAENQIGLLVAFNAILVSVVEMPLVHKLEKGNVLRSIAWGALFLFAGFAILPFSTGFAYALFTVFIWSIGEMLVFPMMAGLIANRATDANRGKYMGMLAFNFSLAFVIGPVIGSGIYTNFGGDMLWFSSGVVGIFVWGSILFAGRGKK